ncbi:nitrogen fixation protein FixI [Sphingorhabdus lutea]|uniref:Nitrogen fixation protein FixI n=2 Tax=Sphingorhabdus lutea TaxID=1913578 RepID=A0A1L3JEF9_9SPHN|nr:heavy metal translocating P-type ATPase [Sphingorhabdus lutea]APG63506.1 nitrogen fixation protein FixI [Sphingorhabdus lutea]
MAKNLDPQPAIESNFAVPDIRCAGCISKLENGLILSPQIISARVNFTTKQVVVHHIAGANMADIIAAFALLGFEAHQIEKNSIDNIQNDSKSLLMAMGVAGFAMMNIMLLSVSIWSGAEGSTRDMFHWLSAAIALPTIAYSGRPFFTSAWRALRHGGTNMDVPISIGVILASGLSLYETATHGPHAYFDGAVMLLFFLLTGRWLDSVMRDRARSGVTSLLKNMGNGAMVIDEKGHSHFVDSTALLPHMVMIIAAGERLPADGVIIYGKTQLDLSLLTGESQPCPANVNDKVLAGTLNIGSPIHVRITEIGAFTAIADIARLMGEAAQSKSRYVRIADRAAKLYAPAVHLLALLAFAGWMIMGAGVHQSLLIAVAVLIITCPCALGLAVPAAQIVTAGALMRSGILVKDGSALERLAEIDMAIFDKTGTLTMGRPEPVNLHDATDLQCALMLSLAQHSRHPLSKALTHALQQMNISPAIIEDIDEDAGMGIGAKWQDIDIFLGRHFNDEASNSPVNNDEETLSTNLFMDGKSVFTIFFTDNLRGDAKDVVHDLKLMNIPASIMSGDKAKAVAPITKLLGMTAQTAMLPQDKLAAIKRFEQAGHHVLMIGDGLNDGPALAAGHASMAPGSASDAGKNAADFIFMGDNLRPIIQAINAARKTKSIVRQNFQLAIGYNIFAVPLAIFGYVTPLIAALAMSGSSLIVVANALRLRGAAK